MRILLIGGTGLLGAEGARQLIAHGHQVRAVALPPLPAGLELPPEMELIFGNYLAFSDTEIRELMQGCEGFIFAAGVDERIEGQPPIYSLFEKYNITPLQRLLTLARECGIRHVVVLGSYFSYFAQLWPDCRLYEDHPYIRSRVDQEKMALSFASDSMAVAVLQLPYIFGAQPGRKPVWVFLVGMIRGMKGATFYPKGGSAMVTVRQVGQGISGALEKNQGGRAYPIGFYNLTWVELLKIFHKYMSLPGKPVITIPTGLFALSCWLIRRKQLKKGLEGGLNLVKFARTMATNLFINRQTAADDLGIEEDDLDAAIGESVRVSLMLLKSKEQAVDMRGE